MNAQRLRDVLFRLRDQLSAAQVDSRLADLETALQNQVGNPNQPSFQSNVFQAVEQLRTALRDAHNEPSTTLWSEALKEVGLERLLPAAIFERARAAVENSNVWPAVALEQVRELRRDLTESQNRITQSIDDLTWLRISEAAIPPDKAEVGVLIPRSAVGNNLDKFGDEARDLNNLFNAISLAVTGQADDIQIDSIGSTDFSLFVWMNPLTVKVFASAVREIFATYKDWIEIQDLRDDHRFKKALRKKTLEAIEADMRTNVGKQINIIATEIMKNSPLDENTQNDAGNRLRNALKEILDRYTKGYLFDARASKEAESSDDPTVSETAKAINEIGRAIERINIPSEKLLELPPGDGDPGGDDDGDQLTET